MKNNNFRSLLGDLPQLSAERAMSELRSGRPVRLKDRENVIIVTAFENLDEASYEALRMGWPDARIVLSAARLRRLRAPALAAGVIALKPYAFGALDSVVSGVATEFDGDTLSASSLETAALELVRLSLLLPAAVIADEGQIAHEDRDGIMTVEAEAVRRFQSGAIQAMRVISRAPVPLEGVENCEFIIFRGGEGLREQVAIVIGNPDPREPVLVRIHSACLTGDLFGSLKCDCGDQLRGTVQRMAEDGGGILLYLDQEGRGNGIANKIRAYGLQHQGHDTYDADEILGFENDHRRFDMAAVMLRLLGYDAICLMTNNPNKIKALEEAGLKVVTSQRVIARTNGHNARYIAAKRDKAGHYFEHDVLKIAAGGKL